MPESLICPRCGAANPPGSQSCANCGWAPQPVEPQGPPHDYTPPVYGPQGGYTGQQQPYAQSQQPFAQPQQPYEAVPPYVANPPRESQGGGRRLLLIIIPVAVAVALVATLAIVFVPRLLHRAAPVPGPVTTASPAANRPTAAAPTSQQSPRSSASPSPSKSPSRSPTPQTTDYAKLGPKVASGILKVVASGCQTGGTMIGSAFLIGNRTAVASLSSLAGAEVIGLTNGHNTYAATVSGVDPARGIVILRLAQAPGGHVFSVDSATPATGDPVGSFGVAATGTKISLARSKINSPNAELVIGGSHVTDVADTGTTVDAGLSGAPTLAATGDANGMVLLDQSNKMMVVPGTTIKEAITKTGGKLPEVNCQRPLGPNLTPIAGSAPKPTKSLFTQYFGGINAGDYQAAFGQLSGQLRSSGYQNYVKGWTSSYDFNIVVHSASPTGAHVTFDSIFAKGRGPAGTDTCARWDIDYQFVEESGQRVINKALPHSGPIFRRC